MKIRNLLIAALLMVGSAPVMAQMSLENAVKVVNSNASAKEKEAACKEALKPYKKDAKAYATIGRAYMAAKDLVNAGKYAELAVKANKNSAEGYLLRGDIAVMNDNPGLAASEYQSAQYFEPKNPEGYRKYAYIYRGSDPNQAVEYLQKIRDIDPTYPVDAEAGHIYYMAAKAKGKDYMEKALACYQKADPAKLENSYLTEYALIAFASGKFDLSRQLALEGLKNHPRNAGYNRLALYNSVELKKYDDALNYADRLLNKSDSVEVTANDYKYCALANVGKEDYKEAVKYYGKQIELAGDDQAQALVWKDIANTYKLEGDYPEAYAAYEKFMKNNPKATATDYSSWANLYRLAAANETGKDQETDVNHAVELYKQMMERFPTSADYSNFMSARTISLLDPTQQKGLALPYYQALYNSITGAGVKDKNDKTRLTEACTYMGVYYFKIKDDATAAKPFFEKLQELDPENALAKQVLETYK